MSANLIRQIAMGESLSFDQGRIRVTLQDKSGRRASLKLELAEDVTWTSPDKGDIWRAMTPPLQTRNSDIR